jgi:hydrogenase-4 component B
MELIITFIAIIFIAIVSIPMVGVKGKGVIAVGVVCLLSVISSIPAIGTLEGNFYEYILPGSIVTGAIPVRIDALSGWFILTINFTFITGAFYGFHYMKAYRLQSANLSMHSIAFILTHGALVSICVLQNSIAFLFAWEIMALSAFILVIFEHNKRETLKAGINYLINSHVSIIFLTLAFIWAGSRMNSYDFKDIGTFSELFPLLTSLALFLCFFIGFAIKAGFVPFHTWLPHAHPAAPSHVSGVMSGVIIKIGIYGILRMLLLIKTDYLVVGYFILAISVVSGVYGVMLAILQHNLKKLLAYHSIENIGIIGIGIGLGCIGKGSGNQLLTLLGFAGALLHVLNHSLFKSMLFFGAGNVYQSAHTMNIEQLGGLGKRMPHTALLFLVAALAICGLPPFNGFVSEFLIYSGLFGGMTGTDISWLSMLVMAVTGLALIGGLALMCFTKAFGTVFLGVPRVATEHTPQESGLGKLLPMYGILVVMLAIGIFPQYVVPLLAEPVHLFNDNPGALLSTMAFPFIETMAVIGYGALGFFGLVGLVLLIRWKITSQHPVTTCPTWVCAYTAPNAKMQYTASSFVRSFSKLAEPLLLIHKEKKDIDTVFPAAGDGVHETHPDDKAEEWLIRYPLMRLRQAFNRFSFLQNGNPQIYVLYGLVFITLVLGIPMIYEALMNLFHFFNHI